MIHIADRRVYELGRFQIVARPLDENPAWTTHHIYLGETLVGRQLSVPSLSDCEGYVRGNHRVLYTAMKEKQLSVYGTNDARRKWWPGKELNADIAPAQ